MQLEVAKLEGAGNDFVVLDGRKLATPDAPAMAPLVRALCDRRRGIGADGLLIVAPARTSRTHFDMRYFNADGGEAEMCGNGARCIARFAHDRGAAPARMRFTTAAGEYEAVVEADSVQISFPDIHAIPRPWSGEAGKRMFRGEFLTAGVPHLVIPAGSPADLAELDIVRWGRALRRHPDFAPAGTNANFIAWSPAESALYLRTYERGVEDETLACGTGSVASAAVHARAAGLAGPQRITVIPSGGDRLEIGFDISATGLSAVTLGGPARYVFCTRVEWDAAAGLLSPAGGDSPSP